MATLNTITIEQLEALASQVENDDETEQARLLRLCRAMVRILAARQPEAFERGTTSITDESGHWDNSFPPKAERHRTGPRIIVIRGNDTAEIPTSTGFYYDFVVEPTELGCYVGRDGTFYGVEERGTAHFGQYAAHPGNCNRDITREWIRIDPTLDDLRAAEPILRAALAEFIGTAAA